ncbi:MAG: hypothetical protein AB7F86_03400 [Bdellovibrionales bacterium]
MIHLVSLCLILGFAAQKLEKKPEQILVHTVHGDKVGNFDIQLSGKEPTLKLKTSDGFSWERKLRPADVQYLKKEFAKLPQLKGPPESCHRSSMEVLAEINGKRTVKWSCFGIKSSTSPQFHRFARLLTASL